jgi:hypothetical protein
MSELPNANPQASASQSPQRSRPREGVSQACWICSYLGDRLAADSGASDMERDRVLGERQRHRSRFHQAQDFGYGT